MLIGFIIECQIKMSIVFRLSSLCIGRIRVVVRLGYASWVSMSVVVKLIKVRISLLGIG